MPLKITTSAETTIRPWPNKRQLNSIAWRPRQRHVLRRLLPTKIVTSDRQKMQNKTVIVSTDSAWTFRLARRWCRSMQWHPWPTSHSWAKSTLTLFAPTDLRAVHTASRLNFIVIHCLCFRLGHRTVLELHAVSPNKLPLISSSMLDRSPDCLLTWRVTKQRDSFKTRLTDSYFQFVATPAESDRVTTDTQFLSCSLAGRKCWKWWNR